MQDVPAEKPPAAPIPRGWRRGRRRRRKRTFDEDFPSWLDKIRAILALVLYGLTLAVFFAGPFAIYVLAYFYGFKWDYDIKVTGLILLPAGLILLALGYGVDPGIARSRRKREYDADASQARGEAKKNSAA